MQHVLRCWERQSDGSEYTKTFGGRGSAPDPAEGAYSAPANSLVGGEGLAVPSQEPHPPLSALQASPLHTPTPELVPTPLHMFQRLLCIWLIPKERLFIAEADFVYSLVSCQAAMH